MTKTYVTAYAETPLSRARVDKGEKRLTIEQYYAWALSMVLQQTGLSLNDLRGIGVGVTGSAYPRAEIWSAEVVQNLGLEPRLLLRGDHGGANGAALLVAGALAIQAGYVDHFLILGADTPMNITGEAALTWRYELDYLMPVGMMGPNSMAAMMMQRQIHQYGYKPEHYGKISVSQRENASKNPNAYFRTPLKMDEYLNSPLISDPLRMLDICPFVNGGFALLLSRDTVAKKVTDKPVKVAGFGSWHNLDAPNSLKDITTTGVKNAVKQALEMSGTKQRDIGLFNAYDDYTPVVIMQLEDAGFCEKGKAGKFLEETDITYKGHLPLNTGGGLLSYGQAGMAGGMHHLVEAVRQQRGEAGERQVKDLRYSLVTAVGALEHGGTFINNYAIVFGGE
ncbi:thiolase [Candidatus Caldarchaeum subterraneum]|uniref:Thiolase n=1 Tax=Caldiarchaeum subterraneum TaxID=311458 RepID=E6N7Z5_CALS0|nr:thiolase [Candidatus Caldarchaeum subterraneum]BAJ48426.1 thiolase [Candidatus Caldarchaeum subterraneum]BAJ51186.1 thiolase [Candidatus Caldarchaeum subterraneum]